jgi:dTDP-4-amino-4,6-dideoxygalactose transaminase
MEEAGISTNVHYKPLPLLTAYKNLGFDIEDYPNAYHLFENELSLPIYSTLTDEEVDYIIENLLDILKEY